ncbi:hypothetical protein SPRG_12823 [Saprolegnia parasitica CBS 223.65]|uniref:Uncharacterized protein n=1 Tax=Saprolegnia parasitica (strain CBS 223.65) TaxID=695850 RepID=A0A067BTT7_SAPPC|nr:hypothetical protein SPRG_12823 [Saprolegnia parasitica CBS 223.65]KDO21959.1 hypothetical protein SPRG_12823 [Saprolegnia parasitica CBS 223.65]|eukprot:XP_012207301.1 hypothetical protein SPRG_12823 [Saprolegnia parasitica CBS 223.65]
MRNCTTLSTIELSYDLRLVSARYHPDSVSYNIMRFRLDVQELDDQNVAANVSTALEQVPSLEHLELFNVRRGPALTAVLEAAPLRSRLE